MVSSYQKFIATLTYEHISKILIQIDVFKIFFIWVKIVLVIKICNPETLITISKTHTVWKEKKIIIDHDIVLSSFMTYHLVGNKSNTTDATCWAGTAFPSGHFSSLPVFNEVRVARSLVAYIVFCISLFILLFDNSVVCHSSFYDVSLPLWHFHTFLIAVGIFLDCTGHFCSFNGYSSEIHPGITQEFQTAAMRWGHTLVTPGLWRR
jgi:hypothetical protein